MDVSFASDLVRGLLRDAGYQEWEGGRPGFVVEGDPEGGWVGVTFYPAFPGFPGSSRRRARGLQKYRDILSVAGLKVTDSPYSPGVLRVTLRKDG